MIKYAFVFFLPFLILSCASTAGNDGENPVDRLKAENRMIKKNQNLALRENKVLKVENQTLKAETAALSADITSLRENYRQDMDRMDERYEALCCRFEALERESDALVKDLIAINTDLERNHAAETEKLKKQLQAQADSFTAERAAANAEFHSRMTEMDNQLAAAKQTLREKEAELLVLAENLEKTTAAAARLETTLKEINDSLARKEKENQDLMSATRELQANIAAKQSIIDALPANCQLQQEPALSESPMTP